MAETTGPGTIVPDPPEIKRTRSNDKIEQGKVMMEQNQSLISYSQISSMTLNQIQSSSNLIQGMVLDGFIATHDDEVKTQGLIRDLTTAVNALVPILEQIEINTRP